ncbi:MAG: Rap1a/Tai family immunity protein [Terracidiphilus sp.]|jgi:CTP synthase (UTP-ammonia lyase)
MKKFPLLLSIGILYATSTVAFSQSAEEMVSNCKWISESKVSADQIEIPTDFHSGVCWGAFGTLQTAITVVPYSFPKEGPLLGVCAPEKSTESQLIRIFIAYTERHPEQLHKDYFFVAIAALKEVFPCPK